MLILTGSQERMKNTYGVLEEEEDMRSILTFLASQIIGREGERDFLPHFLSCLA
jgi:hypothetical protein